MPAIINKNEELQFDPTQTVNENGSVVIGHLSGPCADIINSTRNGRKYSEQLWEKVFKDPITKEYFNCGGIFGELGHPLDREETDMEKIALCMPKEPEKKNGKLWATFDILDTPNGRILKTLCQYGYKMGISSRGSGDIITDYDGNESVDPETYQFNAFDAVLLPAVKEARLKFSESLSNTKTLKAALAESLNKATPTERKIMNETLSKLELDFEDSDIETEDLNEETKYICKFNVYDLDYSDEEPIKTLYNIDDGEDFINKNRGSGKNYALYYDRYAHNSRPENRISHQKIMESKALKALFNYTNLCEWLVKTDQKLFEKFLDEWDYDQEIGNIDEEQNEVVDNNETVIAELQEVLKEKQKLEQQIMDLQEQLSVRSAKEKKLSESLNATKNNISKLSEDSKKAKALTVKVTTLSEDLNATTANLNQMKDTQHHLQERLAVVKKQSKHYKESLVKSEKEVETLRGSLTESNEKLDSINEAYLNLQKDYELKKAESSKKMNEAVVQLDKYKRIAKKAVDKYVDSQAIRLGVTANEIKNRLPESYTFNSIDKVCKDLQEYQLSMSRLPFNTLNENVKIKTSVNEKSIIPADKSLSDDVDLALLHLAGIK